MLKPPKYQPRRGFCLLVLLIWGAVPLYGQETPEQAAERARLEDAQAALAASQARKEALDVEAKALAQAVEIASREMVRLAAVMAKRDDALTRLEFEIALLEDQIGEQQSRLQSRRQELAEILAALQRLSQRPRQLVMLRPGAAIDTVRSADLLSGVLPVLQVRAASLREEIATLQALNADLRRDQALYVDEVAAMAADRTRLQALRAERAQSRDKARKLARLEQKRLESLAREVRDIEGLLAKLEEEAARQAVAGLTPQLDVYGAGRRFKDARGRLPSPAAGTVKHAFGAALEGGRSRGMYILTRSASQVVSPFDGQIVFAGPFRTYGQLLIIDHGDGYHSLLAGMQRIDGVVGQWVLAGEPIGEMGDGSDEPPGGVSKSPQPTLYVELRQQGKPINPQPWLAADLGKVNG